MTQEALQVEVIAGILSGLAVLARGSRLNSVAVLGKGSGPLVLRLLVQLHLLEVLHGHGIRGIVGPEVCRPEDGIGPRRLFGPCEGRACEGREEERCRWGLHSVWQFEVVDDVPRTFSRTHGGLAQVFILDLTRLATGQFASRATLRDGPAG